MNAQYASHMYIAHSTLSTFAHSTHSSPSLVAIAAQALASGSSVHTHTSSVRFSPPARPAIRRAPVPVSPRGSGLRVPQ